MSNITVGEAQAWAQENKLDLGNALDGELEVQVSSQVLARVATAYDTSSWVTADTTPQLIKTICAMYYVAWMYEKLYSDDNSDENAYAQRLMERADAMLQNILDGDTPLPGIPPTNDQTQPAFYPTDISSATEPTIDDPSLGPAKFTMGSVF